MRTREAQIAHNKKNEEKRIKRKKKRRDNKYFEVQRRIKRKIRGREIRIPRPRKVPETPKPIAQTIKPVAQVIKEPELLKKESIWALLIWLPLKRLFLRVKRVFGG